MFIKEKDIRRRLEIIEFLEGEGYGLANGECRDRQDIIDYFLPIVVDMESKEYSMMGNVTCAAAAASGGCLLTSDEFFKRYSEQ